MIEYVDKDGNVRPHSKKGDWRHRWLKHEDGYPVVASRGPSPITEEGWQKIMSEHANKMREALENSATKIAREKIRELKENPQNKIQEFLERFEEESFEDFEKYEDGDEKKLEQMKTIYYMIYYVITVIRSILSNILEKILQ